MYYVCVCVYVCMRVHPREIITFFFFHLEFLQRPHTDKYCASHCLGKIEEHITHCLVCTINSFAPAL